jgi:hypothetical protein
VAKELTFGVKIQGGTEAERQLQALIRAQEKLARGGVNPATGVGATPGDIASDIARANAALAQLQAFALRSGAGGRLPPIIPPPIIPGSPAGGGRFNPLQFAAGLIVAPFHPFAASRELNLGLGQPFGAGFGGVGIILAGLAVSSIALRQAFEHLKQAVEEGARTYQHAAKLGASVSQTAQLEFLGKILGLSPETLDQLAIRGTQPQKGERQAFLTLNDLKAVLGSGAGANQIGSLQQIKNLLPEAGQALTVIAFAVQSIQQNAKPLQEIFAQFQEVGIYLRTVFQDIAVAILPIIKHITEGITGLLIYADIQLRNVIALEQFLGLVPKGSNPGSAKIQATPLKTGASSAWERMGFVIGGFATDAARETAKNTKEIANNTKEMLRRGFFPGGGARVDHEAIDRRKHDTRWDFSTTLRATP